MQFSRSLELIEQGIERGLHIGAQLYVSRRLVPLADLGIGECRGGVALNAATVMLWLSSSKPLGAAAILQLQERGRLHVDDPVVRHIPEFGTGGKQTVTIRHLLTHTGGFRWVDTGWPHTTWDEVISRICRAPLEARWVPGERAGYHAYSSWYILGELVRRIDGRNFSDYVRQEVFEPLGMRDSWIGMDVETYHEYGDRLGLMQNTEKPGMPPHDFSTALGAAGAVPGGNGHGPIRELAAFYETLLCGGRRGGTRLLAADTVQWMTRRHRSGMFDETFRHTIDWGLGLILDSKQHGEAVPYGYGRHASPTTFGHSGSQSSVAFCDPEHELVVALVFNGRPGERRHQARVRAVLDAIYEDAGLDAPRRD